LKRLVHDAPFNHAAEAATTRMLAKAVMCTSAASYRSAIALFASTFPRRSHSVYPGIPIDSNHPGQPALALHAKDTRFISLRTGCHHNGRPLGGRTNRSYDDEP
jgi:hypothetical protein